MLVVSILQELQYVFGKYRGGFNKIYVIHLQITTKVVKSMGMGLFL